MALPETDKKTLTVAVVQFPGSNCFDETVRFFTRAGHQAETLWHKDTQTPNADLLVIPGGFAFGDRVYDIATGSYTEAPGVQALKSPVMKVVRNWAVEGKTIIGICNGWQILTHEGLLPESLEQNDSKLFTCEDVECVVDGRSFMKDKTLVDQVFPINVGHGFGKFVVSEREHRELTKRGQIFLRYLGLNPSNSYENVAGVCNEAGTIWGMMPHPERIDSPTRILFLEAIEKYVRG